MPIFIILYEIIDHGATEPVRLNVAHIGSYHARDRAKPNTGSMVWTTGRAFLVQELPGEIDGLIHAAVTARNAGEA